MTTTQGQDPTTSAPQGGFDFFAAMSAVDLDNPVVPLEPVGDGEVAIGIASQQLVRACHARLALVREHNIIADAMEAEASEHITWHITNDGPHDCSSFWTRQIEQMHSAVSLAARVQRMDCIIRGLFLLEFPELGEKDNFGLREGGQVVWWRNKASNVDPSGADVLGALQSIFSIVISPRRGGGH